MTRAVVEPCGGSWQLGSPLLKKPSDEDRWCIVNRGQYVDGAIQGSGQLGPDFFCCYGRGCRCRRF